MLSTCPELKMRYNYRYKETIVTILVDEEKYYHVAVQAILEARKEIESVIREDPFFLTSLEPYHKYGGEITKKMVEAGELAGIGPMASVAGTIAHHAVRRMIENGAGYAVVDNGGDIAIFTDRELVIGIYTGKGSRWGFRIEPSDLIQVICSSSGSIGHSISFGYADVATVFGDDGSICDAFATALGNEIGKDSGEAEMNTILESFYEKSFRYLKGLFAVKGEVIGFAGEVPELVEVQFNPDLITRG